MRRAVSCLLIGVLALTACGSDDGSLATATPITVAPTTLPITDLAGSEASTSTEATVRTTVPTATVPATAAPMTTDYPSTTVGITTVETLPPATTPSTTLPVPAAPPAPRADEPYEELGTIEIPKLGITKTFLEGITLNTLDRGPGHWPGTAMPGQVGNTVIAGHRTSHDKPFRDIDQLVPGDQVIFTTSTGRYVYEVTSTTVVKPDALYIIDQTATPTATLFACHPPGSTRQRIVVSLALVQ